MLTVKQDEQGNSFMTSEHGYREYAGTDIGTTRTGRDDDSEDSEESAKTAEMRIPDFKDFL